MSENAQATATSPTASPFCSLVVKGARMASWWFTRSCIVSLTGGPDGGGA